MFLLTTCLQLGWRGVGGPVEGGVDAGVGGGDGEQGQHEGLAEVHREVDVVPVLRAEGHAMSISGGFMLLC